MRQAVQAIVSNGIMSSYRHLSHAGNHGDVLKHVCFVSCLLELLKSSNNGLVVLDTHAGIGNYDLTRQTTNEHKDGIQRVLEKYTGTDSPISVQEYATMVRSFNGDDDDDELRLFPGSPALAGMLLREDRDEHNLWEIHPSEFQALQSFLHSQSFPSKAFCQDGFAHVASKLRGSKRHSFILIDPPYKLVDEYTKTLQTVKQLLQTDSSAIIMVWIPQLPCQEAQALDCRLVEAASDQQAPWLRASLTVSSHGLIGSTVIIVNPPVGLYETLQSVVPWLAETLSQTCSDYSVTQG
jgi:23S rRNA (adenine2030-N6)-methyltransferase